MSRQIAIRGPVKPFLLLVLALLAACIDPTGLGDGARAELINDATVWTVVEAHLAPCDATDWGENRLAAAIPPWSVATVDVDPGCWDVRLTAQHNLLPASTYATWTDMELGRRTIGHFRVRD